MSAVFITAAHAGLITTALFWHTSSKTGGTPLPAIMIDLSVASASPEPSQMDLAPGPQMQEAEPPAPEAEAPKAVEETIAPTPPQENPEIASPPEEKPQPAPVTEKPKPKKPKKAAAPRTTAPPRAERVGPTADARAGANAAAAAATPSYRERLAAHLQRFKQYPARAGGEVGTAMLSFTVNRHGQVLGSRLARSSGSAALDDETMAMIRRAQPLPSFPPEMAQSSIGFTVPVRFSLR